MNCCGLVIINNYKRALGGGGDIIMLIAAGPLAWCRLYQNTQQRVFACVALSALPFLIWRFLWSLLALEIEPFVHAGIDRAWSKVVNIDGNFPCAARKCASIPCASFARMRTFLLRRKTSYSEPAPAWVVAYGCSWRQPNSVPHFTLIWFA